MPVKHVTGGSPKSVNIVALGPSQQGYHAAHYEYTPVVPPADETWTLNKGLRTVRADCVFVMDDLIGEARKSGRYAHDINELMLRGVPLITSTVDALVLERYPGAADALHEYPLDDVLAHVGVRACDARKLPRTPPHVKEQGDRLGYYLHNSVPYILAYALAIGVEDVRLFGADYSYPERAARESGRANVEYWVGMLRAWGVDVTVTADTTLLDTMQGVWLYGFGARPPARRWPDADLIERVVPFLRPWTPSDEAGR